LQDARGIGDESTRIATVFHTLLPTLRDWLDAPSILKSNSIPNSISRYSGCLCRPHFAGGHRDATSACRPADFTIGLRCRRSHLSRTTTS
jgi:hypothetical protein